MDVIVNEGSKNCLVVELDFVKHYAGEYFFSIQKPKSDPVSNTSNLIQFVGRLKPKSEKTLIEGSFDVPSASFRLFSNKIEENP